MLITPPVDESHRATIAILGSVARKVTLKSLQEEHLAANETSSSTCPGIFSGLAELDGYEVDDSLFVPSDAASGPTTLLFVEGSSERSPGRVWMFCWKPLPSSSESLPRHFSRWGRGKWPWRTHRNTAASLGSPASDRIPWNTAG